jgi:23S rRNA-intervening sequence protein
MQTELSERVLDYGLRTIKVVESLPKTLVGRRIGDQLLRSATSVGANFEEAQAAESRDDFVHKLQVALKELRSRTIGCCFSPRPARCPSSASRRYSTSPTNWWPCYRRLWRRSKGRLSLPSQHREWQFLPFAFCLLLFAFCFLICLLPFEILF